MAENSATILIPDISGFTEFMTSTELSHGAHVINTLIETIVRTVGEEYEVSEIEGDAVLLIKKGLPTSKKEILDICLKIFNDFHFERKRMQQQSICPCGACQSIVNLTLKFVVHHGPLAEIKVGRFVKQSGPEMIVAHRLLKNSIDNHEYLLMTEKLLQQVSDSAETVEMEWTQSSEEYDSIGKVDYRFTLLSEARKKIPEPPSPESYYRVDDTSYFEIPIAADARDVYMVMMNIPDRADWIPGLIKVEQDLPAVFIGSVHRCTFNNYRAIISPVRVTLSEEEVIYAETCRIEERELSLVYEFVFRKITGDTSHFACRFMNAGAGRLSEEVNEILFERMKEMATKLKDHCEKLERSFFVPDFRKG